MLDKVVTTKCGLLFMKFFSIVLLCIALIAICILSFVWQPTTTY